MSEEILLDADEAASLLSISRAKLVRMARRDEVPSILLPDREIRFRRADLIEWVANFRKPSEQRER